jgi:hypothetical protein
MTWENTIFQGFRQGRSFGNGLVCFTAGQDAKSREQQANRIDLGFGFGRRVVRFSGRKTQTKCQGFISLLQILGTSISLSPNS